MFLYRSIFDGQKLETSGQDFWRGVYVLQQRKLSCDDKVKILLETESTAIKISHHIV